MNERSENGERGFSLQTVDKSIRVVTTTIQGVKKWSEYRDQVPLVFEIFGKSIVLVKYCQFSVRHECENGTSSRIAFY